MDYEIASLYNEHKAFIWNITSKYFTNRWDREEAFQEIFIRIHRYLPRFQKQEDVNIRTWLYKIAVSTSINYLKKNKVKGMINELIPFTFGLFVTHDMDTVEDDDSVNMILSPLNPRQRAVVVLRELEGLSYEEIAEIMSMNLGTVKSTLNRAKQKMKEFLEKEGEKNVTARSFA